MTQLQIQELFKQRYNQAKWKQFLGETFYDAKLFIKPQVLTGFDNQIADQVLRLGDIFLNENGIERQISVYEVTLTQGVILERNRVGLRNLLRKYWQNIDGAFIVYYHPESTNWRFTYVSELTGYDAEGEFIEIKTEPKRYTYVLGENESVKTAVERFETIIKKGKNLTLDDVKEAFSVEKLDQTFFAQYKKQYEQFCQYMVSQKGILETIFNGNEKAIRDFNKKLLGRIVFLFFIQKKGWLGVQKNENWGEGDSNFLSNQYNNFPHKELFYQDFLAVLFFDTLNTTRNHDLIELVKNNPCRIPYLNGGLFSEDDQNQRNLIFPPHLFENLFNFFNQYNFTIYEDDPNDHTVAVDPEMLGHIFENLLEDNKDKGAYYTPKEIVHYMCQESLIEYLTTWFENEGYNVIGYANLSNAIQPALFPLNELRKGQLELEVAVKSNQKQIDRSLIERLLKKTLNNQDQQLILQYYEQFNLALDTVKICDPAIGSGAFPMGLLHEIFTAKQTLHTFEYGNTTNFKASEIKLNIIQNSIYGVDIEKGAVDIARLRFWLSLIVDESEPKALPNLDYKIVVGNSLVSKLGDDIIDIDWEMKGKKQTNLLYDVSKPEAILKQISDQQKEFFNPDSDKKKLASDIRNLKIDLLISQLELMVKEKGIETKPTGKGKTLTKQTELYLQTMGWKNTISQLKKLKTKPNLPLNFFDWKLDFPEVMNEEVTNRIGFDIVIGNPPYVKEYTNKEVFNKIPYYQGKMDLWYSFACVGIDLLKKQGLLSFIATNNWVTNSGASLMRNKVLEDSKIIKLIDFGSFMIFENASIQTMIMFFKNENNIDNYKFELKRITSKNALFSDVLELLNYIKTENNEFIYPTIYKKELFNKSLTFSNNHFESILNKIKGKTNFFLDSKKEIAQGIVIPQDYVNKKSKEILGLDYKVGQGIFVLSEDEKQSMNLLKNELQLIKPYYTTNQLQKWYGNSKNNEWIIYTDSMYKKLENIKPFPNLKKHLDQFQTVITSDNKPYGLHRAREESFFIGEKIIALRKCVGEPKFTYTDFDCHVSATFYVIKTNRINLKYLTGLLNSKMIAFWLKNKGKMQGNNYQLDKEPLLEIPIFNYCNPQIIENIVNEILTLKSQGKDTTKLEQQIDNLVYKLYELSYEEVKIIDPEFSLSEKEYEEIKV